MKLSGRVIIAGGRDITNYDLLLYAISCLHEFNPTTIISGGARGVDALGEEYAKENNIPLETFPADWNIHGRSAGYRRNITMANSADCLLAIWDGKSKGTKHMIDIAKEKGLETFVFVLGENNESSKD